MRKNYVPSLIFMGIVILVTLINLYPTVKWYSMSRDARAEMELTDPAQANELIDNVIKLGLDLQGGMHLVLEVQTDQIPEEARENATDRALRIIRNRIDRFGVSEPLIFKQGDSRIVVQLPGIASLDRAKDIIGQTAMLEFKLVAQPEEIEFNLRRLDDHIRRNILNIETRPTAVDDSIPESPQDTVDAAADVSRLFGIREVEEAVAEGDSAVVIDDELKRLYTDTERPLTSLLSAFGDDIVVTEDNIQRVQTILADSMVVIAVRSGYEFAWGEERRDPQTDERFRMLYLLRSRPELTGDVIRDANATFSQGGDLQGNEPIVSLTMTSEGSRTFARVTGRNLQRRLAIVLDANVIMAPVIQTQISDGRAQITGIGAIEEAKDLAIVLEAGALPAPVEIIEERSVGATLGMDSIAEAKTMAIITFILVALFMIAYYLAAGVFSVVALCLNLTVVLGTLSMFGFTLTLPGIAGLILTIGMAVDANVLIFERIREELRVGKSLRNSIESGFSKAKLTILDANITTIFTAIILYYYGSGPIRGFALTLMIGILATLIVSLVFTKLALELSEDHLPKLVNFGKLSMFTKAAFDILSKKKAAFIFSAVLTVAGLGSLAYQGLNLGIDFTGGSLVHVRIDEKNLTEGDIRSIIAQVDGITTSEVRKFETEDRGYSEFIITVQQDQASEEVLRNLTDKMRLAYSDDGVDILRQEMVGPVIGDELERGAILSILLSMLAIVLYLSIRFKFWYAIGTIVAVLHDVIMIVGIFSILRAEVNVSVIAAVLTIVGYSINDTIVVFDRVRENTKMKRGVKFHDILNLSINETLPRTIITSLTTLFAACALFLFGPETIRNFSGALLIGIVFGTYSSIFIASPVLEFCVRKFSTKK